MHKYLTIFVIAIFSVFTLKAQQSGQLEVEGIQIEKDTSSHSPKLAGFLSLGLPGLGQAYNKKYWKIPIIYAGFAGLTYLIVDNHKSYTEYRDAYIARIELTPGNEDLLPQYTTENIRVMKNIYWKDRDFYIIMTITLYAIQALDAVVDAHFWTYDMSSDLSFRIKPSIEPTLGTYQTNATGIGVSLNF
ncbi:MAG: hypothetical protein KAG84_03735 [Bacteroidales bacterium]|nr:hypothetical protein [Bacteroidales bacterium]